MTATVVLVAAVLVTVVVLVVAVCSAMAASSSDVRADLDAIAADRRRRDALADTVRRAS